MPVTTLSGRNDASQPQSNATGGLPAPSRRRPRERQPPPPTNTQTVDSAVVVQRYEAVVLDLLRQLTQPHPTFTLRSHRSAAPIPNDQAAEESAPFERDFFANPRGVAMVLEVMAHLFPYVQSGKHCTQRDLYYCLGPRAKDAPEVNLAIVDAARVLVVPRQSLGVVACSRGFVAGNLVWNGVDVNRFGSQGMAIPGHIDNAVPLRSTARCILVVEKDAVFQHLAQDKLFTLFPCVMVTGRGFPDLATRALTHRLHTEFGLPVYGLVDYNPSGIRILMTYRSGSKFADSAHVTVPIQWLGLRRHDLKTVDVAAHRQPFTARDKAVAKNLIAHVDDAAPSTRRGAATVPASWRAEVEEMVRGECKYELESVYGASTAPGASRKDGVSAFTRWLQHKLLRGEALP